ncbi:hypothetical protein FY557_13060 [Chryseobacterium sp. SN22]|uniref:hypothetical protein n=1 Tax=Chryseobacterium sp. SN22 TaxID=2606431 RepID=UPI0011ED164D|nr:hypothetical protein [Chryseobacterium sp. SN22]KAA0127542.1 hypothetical protein FY557_13060 [Chryseobacterium sp. SN22]
MLIALAFGNNSANTQSCNNDNNGTVTIQTTNPGTGMDPGTGTDPGDGTDPGTGGPVGGNTGQIPPPFTKP